MFHCSPEFYVRREDDRTIMIFCCVWWGNGKMDGRKDNLRGTFFKTTAIFDIYAISFNGVNP